MKAIYRASFQLAVVNGAPTLFDKIAKLAWTWAFDAKRLGLTIKATEIPVRAESYERKSLARGNEIEALKVETALSTGWGLRLSHPDGEDADLRWTTEICLYQTQDQQVYFSCSLLLSRPGTAYIPLHRRVSRPRLVEQIVSQFGALGAYPLHSKPISLGQTKEDLAVFVKALTAQSRTHPIILITCENITNRPSVDPKTVASQLAGLAHVVVAASPAVSRMLGDVLPARMNCFDGGIRIYWPRFRLGQSPFLHPLWVRRRVLQLRDLHPNEPAFALLERVAEVAICNVHERFLTWTRLEEMGRHKALEEAKAAGKEKEYISLLEEDNQTAQERIKELELSLSLKTEEALKYQMLTDSFRAALDARKQTHASTPEEIELPPSSVEEAVTNATRDYAKQLVFALNSRSEHENSPFEKPDELFDVFTWLATTYFDSKTGRESCPDLDHNLRETQPGWSYSPHQKEMTMKANEDFYRCPWNDNRGRKLWIPEHIRYGKTRRPEETIRIGFAWDPNAKKVVIGFIGQHQDNSKS